MTGLVEIKLKNFRTYTTNPGEEDGFFTYVFDKGVNLLKGTSGVGKSTVFMAVSWCLYKRPGTGNTPLYGGEKDTVVVLSLDNGEMIIKRTSPKSTLTITTPRGVLENEEAQIFINNQFGREHVWKTCNYVSQGSINQLISGDMTDIQRWDVLHTLAFETNLKKDDFTIDVFKVFLKKASDDAGRFLVGVQAKIEVMVQRIEEIRLRRLMKKNQLNDFDRMEMDHPVVRLDEETEVRDLIYELRKHPYEKVSGEQLDALKIELSDLKTDASGIEDDIRRVERELEGYTVSKQMEERNITQELTRVTGEVQTLKRQLRDIDLPKIRECKKTFDGICERIHGLRDMIDRDKLFGTGKDVLRRLKKVFGRVAWILKKQYRVVGLLDQKTRDGISKELDRRRNVDEQTRLRKKLSEASRECILVLGNQFEGREEEGRWMNNIDYDEGENGMVVTCPCCQEEIVAFVANDKIEKLRKHESRSLILSRDVLERVRRRDALWEEVNKLERLATPDPDLVDREIRELSEWRSDIDEWNSLPGEFRVVCSRILERKPIIDESTLSEVNDLDEYYEEEFIDNVEREVKNLESKLESAVRCRFELEKRLVSVEEKYRSLIIENETNLRQLLKKLTDTKEKIRERENKVKEMERVHHLWRRMTVLNVDDVDGLERLLKIRSRIRELERECRDLEVQEETERGVLREEESSNKEMLERLNLLTELQVDVENVETDVLRECVERIGGVTNSFLENAFENPIIVKLVTEKESKGGKSKRHSVGITVKSGKPGADATLVERSLDGFSGGETDRISLGFSNAITTFSPFPMLMLDECISSLDAEMKDRVIRALRQQAKLSNKAVVLVCHDAVEGLFDHICEVK